MTNRRSRLIVCLCLGSVLLLAAADVLAVPTFARRYRTSCATCHSAYPRLNAVGESFRLMGFRFPDDERYRKTEPVEMGDEAYKRLWPEALWPTTVPSHSPLSFITRFMGEVDVDGSRKVGFSYLVPEEVEFVWVGNLGDDLLFYGDIIYLQKDFGGLEPQSWATLKGWLQFQSVVGPEDAFNLRIGTVGTQSMGLFNERDANIYATHFYQYTSWSMPPVDLGEAGLSSFNGNNFTITPQAGIELNGVGERWFYALGVVSGNPLWVSGDIPPSDITFFGQGRGTDRKDVYLQLAYKLGGLPFKRTAAPETGTSLTPSSDFWRDDTSTVLSLWGYNGRAEIEAVDLDGVKNKQNDDFWRLGVGVQQMIKDVSIGGVYVVGKDDNPYGILTDQAVDSTTWNVEVLGFVYPWLIPYGRYEVLDLEMPEGVPGIPTQRDISRFVAGVKMMIRPNVFCTVEGTYYTKGEELEEGIDQTIFILLSVAF